jgi:hypothetical protein
MYSPPKARYSIQMLSTNLRSNQRGIGNVMNVVPVLMLHAYLE